MARVLIVECKQEVSSFNPVLSHYDDFEVLQGPAFFDYHHEGLSEVAGAIGVFTAAGQSVVPGFSARAITSGGVLARASFERICDEFASSLQTVGLVDGVYCCLHGAMQAQEEDDPEGYLLSLLRERVGPSVPLVISLDLHGIPTARMLEACNALVAYHTYPHVDFFDTGERAARLLLRLLRKEIKPVTALVAIPALVRGDELKTETGLFGNAIRAAKATEHLASGLAAGMFIGNPFTDVPALGSYSFVTTDNDGAQAERLALGLAEDFWAYRQHLQAPLISLAEAVGVAKEAFDTDPAASVIFSDAADATSSGASGDSNAILRLLLAQRYQGKVLLPLVDPRAVKTAFEAGVGQTIRKPLGGALDPRFEPLELELKVRLLFDGHMISESHQLDWYAGDTAVLEHGSITIVVTSRPVSLYDRSLFFAAGQQPHTFNLIVVKSPHCQPQFFEAWASKLLNVDAPGSTSANLPSLGHRRCARPIFPLDPEVVFTPKARLFQRD